MAPRPDPTRWRDKTFDELHADGAARFRWGWIEANELAIDVAQEVGLDPTELGPEARQIALLCTAVATVICEAKQAAATKKEG